MAKQTFTTGQVLTAAQMTSLQQTAMLGGAASAKTASYTLVAADAGTAITMSNASATTITVNTALFAAGDTVQITNLGAGVCTITAGTATVNTSASLALAQYESGTLDFTSSSAAIFIKGAGAAGGGKVLQVVQGTTSTAVSISTTTYTDSGITLAITPTLNTSKVLVMVTQQYRLYRNTGTANAMVRLLRGATAVWNAPTIPGLNILATGATETQVSGYGTYIYLDSPATTSSTTYKTQYKCTDTTSTPDISLQVGSNESIIILMEIGA